MKTRPPRRSSTACSSSSNRDKRDIVAELANREGKTLVFSRTRAFAEDLTEHLEDAGIRAVALHGDLNQSRRTRNLQQLTSGRVNVLVATDVAARGIHVDDIDLVIQADAPDEYKTYLHRSGRTGRAGKEGPVVTLIPRNRQRRMTELLGRAEIDVDFGDVAPRRRRAGANSGNASLTRRRNRTACRASSMSADCAPNRRAFDGRVERETWRLMMRDDRHRTATDPSTPGSFPACREPFSARSR